MKAIIWLRALWTSFEVCQAAKRLVFLGDLANTWPGDHDVTPEERITLAAYRDAILRFICGHPNLFNNIWDLAEAQELLREIKNLIEIGEMLIYGDNDTDTATAGGTEPGSRIAEGRAQ